MVAGVNPVLELLRSGGRPLDAVYIDKDKGGKLFEEMLSLARRAGVQVKVVPRPALDGMSQGLRHQGALAIVSPKAYADPYELKDEVRFVQGRRGAARGAVPSLESEQEALIVEPEHVASRLGLRAKAI